MTRCYTVGNCEIRPDERRVLVGGESAPIGARAFDLLMCLIERRDRVVTKDELMESVWPGSIVEENNLTVHVAALRKLLGAEAIATIPGRGYRFARSLQEADGASPALVKSADLVGKRVSTQALGEGQLTLPEQPSLAVMPFDNIGGDPQQEYLVDGLIEDVITGLSRFRSLFVIARNSTFSYKGKAVDVRTIAKELGVRYVVEGSIRRAASRIRVSAQLIDAVTGVCLWAEKYDSALEDVFAVQEELTQAIVAAVAPQIESFEFEKVRGARPGNLTAYELAMRARDTARRADKEAEEASQGEALRLATEAVLMDPGCTTALGTIAYLHWRQVWAGSAASGSDAIEAGLAAARRAVAIDSGDHIAHLWKGMLLLFSGQHDAGLRDLRRAHELNPNDALTLSLLGQYVAGAGDAQAGIRYATDALRLSPRDALRWSFLNSLAWAHFAARDYAGAAASAQRSIDEAPKFYPPHLCLVVSRIGLGETAKAASEFRVLNSAVPQTIAARMSGTWNYSDPGLVHRATTFLRVAAGLEDQDSAARLR